MLQTSHYQKCWSHRWPHVRYTRFSVVVSIDAAGAVHTRPVLTVEYREELFRHELPLCRLVDFRPRVAPDPCNSRHDTCDLEIRRRVHV